MCKKDERDTEEQEINQHFYYTYTVGEKMFEWFLFFLRQKAVKFLLNACFLVSTTKQLIWSLELGLKSLKDVDPQYKERRNLRSANFSYTVSLPSLISYCRAFFLLQVICHSYVQFVGASDL